MEVVMYLLYTDLHQVDLHDNNWRKTVRQRQIGYKAYKGSSREPSRIKLKKILKAMKKRMIRTTLKLTLRNFSKKEQITCVIKVNSTSGYISKHFLSKIAKLSAKSLVISQTKMPRA